MRKAVLNLNENNPTLTIPKGIVELYSLKNGQEFRLKIKEVDGGHILALSIYAELKDQGDVRMTTKQQ